MEDGYHLWTFKEILNHRLTKNGGKNIMDFEVLWDTGENTGAIEQNKGRQSSYSVQVCGETWTD